MRCADDERNAEFGIFFCESACAPFVLYAPGPGLSSIDCLGMRADSAPKAPEPDRAKLDADFFDVVPIVCASVTYAPGSPICSSTFTSRFDPDLNADDGRCASRRAPALAAMPAVLYDPGPGPSAVPDGVNGRSCCAVFVPKPAAARLCLATDRATSALRPASQSTRRARSPRASSTCRA